MICDMTAFVGPYERRPVGVGRDELARMLGEWGVTRVFASRIDHLRMENPHAVDRPTASAQVSGVTVETVPVLDPTVSTWAEHAEAHYQANGRKLPLVRLHPGFHGYRADDLKLLGPLVDWAHPRGTVLQIVVSLDDARRRHAFGQTPDVSMTEVAKAAQDFPHQKFLVSGSTFAALDALKKQRPANLWADTGRIEASEGIKRLFANGWADRLVFASFAPLMIVHSAVARILVDLDDKSAVQVFQQNGLSLLAGL